MLAEPTDHTVGGPFVLDLQHDPLARLVPEIARLGDDPVQPRTLEAREPVARDVGTVGGGREVDGGFGVAEGLFEGETPGDEGLALQIPVAHRQKIEGDEGGGRRLGEQGDARGGGVDALGQGIEVEPRRPGDDDLPVDDAAVGQVLQQGAAQLGEVPVQRLLVATAEHDVGAVAKDDATEPVPLGLIGEAFLLGKLTDELGQHGGHRRVHGKRHRLWLAVHARNSSIGRVFMMRSSGTPVATAFSHPNRCHSS